LSLSSHHHSIGDNLHPLSPLKTLFRGKFALRNEYLLESVQVVLFRIGAKIVFFRELSAQPAPIIPVLRNGLSRFSARVLHPRQHFQQLGYRAKIIYCKSAQIRAIRGEPPAQEDITPEFFRWFCFDI